MKDEEATKEETGDAPVEEKGEAHEEQTGPEKETSVDAPTEEGEIPQQPEVFDDDEKALFEKLMQKIQDAGDLDKELDSDFSSFEERVDSVVDSIDRIENIERTSLEELIYKHDEDEVSADPEKPPTDLKEGDIDKEQLPVDKVKTPPSAQDDIGFGQIYVQSESPYEAIKKGEVPFDYKGDFLDAYGNEVETVLMKMLKLIKIKIKKDDLDKARDLFRVSANLGGASEFFHKEFVPLAEKLGVTVPQDKMIKDDDVVKPVKVSIDDIQETQVLDPELAEEITILQKKATSAIKQLENLIENSDISEENLNKIKAQYETSMELFKNKMFHKSYELALEALKVIKDKVQDSIDNQLQSELYRTKEMLEEYAKGNGIDEPEKVEELKTTFDRAMKAYLTNEFEKANLLTKKVLNTILDLTEEGGGPMKEKADSLRKELRDLKEMNVPSQDMDDLLDALRSAENFIDRRDFTNSEKIIERIETSILELREKSEKYTTARELEIKLTNRVERLKDVVFDLEMVQKKLDFVHTYFKEERFDDVLTIGSEISSDLDLLEKVNKETESKDLLEKLEALMTNVETLDDQETYKKDYKEISKAYETNDLSLFKSKGLELAEELTQKYKTIKVKRARNVASLVIESRILISKLMALNIDTVDMERNIRKSKNLLKEGNHKDGLKILNEAIQDMKKAYLMHVDFLRDYLNIYRDSLEVVMDRHKEEAIVYHLKRKQVPILRKMAEIGNYHKALETYKILESKLMEIITTEDKKESVEEELNEIKFEIYKRKEEGLDISEPLSLYTLAQKRYGEGNVVPAEYLVEVSRRYCESFMPI